MGLSKREKRLLYILLLVVLLSVFILLFQRAGVKLDTLDAEYASVQEESMKVRSALDSLDSLKASLPTIKSEVLSMRAQLRDLLRNRQIDSLLTELALEHDLTPVSLSMNGAQLLPLDTYAAGGEGPQTTDSAYVYTATAVLTVTGAKDDFYAYIDALRALQGVRLTGFTLTAPSGGSAYTATVTAALFMSDLDEDTIDEAG